MELDFIEDEAIKAQVQDAIKAELAAVTERTTKEWHDDVAGLKNKVDEFKQEKIKLQDSLKNFEGVDLEEYHKIREALQDEKRKAFLEEGKIDELILTETSALKTKYEEESLALTEQLSTFEKQAIQYKTLYQDKTRDDVLRDVLANAGVLPTAIPDALMLGSTIFKVTDEGKVEARDAEGTIMKTSDGKLLDVHQWALECKTTRPHWWGQSVSADLSPEGRKYASDSLERKAKTNPSDYMAERRKSRKY